ncbi:MAG: hypothetical protein GX442_09055 [Candidatus Riflebacteria bacterium]|nr:hypothetical protein [Candidatus Riflebacteria bacterium]
MNHRQRFVLWIPLIVGLSLTSGFPGMGPAGAVPPSAPDPAERVARIESLIAGLQQSRTVMAEIQGKAARHLKGNLLKGLVKGAYDTVDWVSLPGKNLLDHGTDLLNKLLFEENSWGHATRQEVIQVRLPPDLSVRCADLSDLFVVMQEVLATKNLDRYDSDNQPFRFTSAWWSPADGKKDTWLQTITRRTYIIRELAGKIVQRLDREIVALRAEATRLNNLRPIGPAKGGVSEVVVIGTCKVQLAVSGARLAHLDSGNTAYDADKSLYFVVSGNQVQVSGACSAQPVPQYCAKVTGTWAGGTNQGEMMFDENCEDPAGVTRSFSRVIPFGTLGLETVSVRLTAHDGDSQTARIVAVLIAPAHVERLRKQFGWW